MAEIILEVQTLLPATDWFFGKPYLRTEPLSSYDPVVIFAQVSVIDSEHLILGPIKKMIPLGIYDFQNLSDLIGSDVLTMNTEIFSKSQFLPPDDE